ncbi:MAG: hypothetical protein MZU91_08295 [Desulfosudis oleivorans]|nr:hypothetical protein [Desulfosudis oleivorans]
MREVHSALLLILEYCGSEKQKPLSAVLIGPNTEFRFPKILGTIIPALHPSLYFAVKPDYKMVSSETSGWIKKPSKEQIEKYENTLDCADPIQTEG